MQGHLCQRVQAPVAGAVRQRGGAALDPAPRHSGFRQVGADEPGRAVCLRGEARSDRGDSPRGSGAAHRRRGHHHQGAQARGTGGDRRPAPAGPGSQGGDQDRTVTALRISISGYN